MTDAIEGYTLGTSGKNAGIRYSKAVKIISILQEYKNLADCRVLEIGTGSGYIAQALGQTSQAVESVDIVDDRKVRDGYNQTIVTDETLPFPDHGFDVVVTNHVLEHVPDQAKHLSEIRRVLKDDGVVYLASPNKWWLTDPHYKLPFISWLPRSVAGVYLRLVKHRKWDIYSVSLPRLKRLAGQAGLAVEDKSWDILRHPKTYGMKLPAAVAMVARMTPNFLVKFLLNFLPTHLKILKPKY